MSRVVWAGQLMRFLSELKVGDDVVCFDRDRRRYLIGKIASDYEWRPEHTGKPHTRRVAWTHEATRESLTTATRNTLGSTRTIFKLNEEAAGDVLGHAVVLGTSAPTAPKPKEEAKNAETLGLITADTFEKADEFIEAQIVALDWKQMQELVASILRAMGYRTTVSAPGSDRGVDIFASPDGLGLQEPRVFVEVKHRVKQMGTSEVRSFLGGRKKGDRCQRGARSGLRAGRRLPALRRFPGHRRGERRRPAVPRRRPRPRPRRIRVKTSLPAAPRAVIARAWISS